MTATIAAATSPTEAGRIAVPEKLSAMDSGATVVITEEEIAAMGLARLVLSAATGAAVKAAVALSGHFHRRHLGFTIWVLS